MWVCLRCCTETKFVFDVPNRDMCVYFIESIEWTLCGRYKWLLFGVNFRDELVLTGNGY